MRQFIKIVVAAAIGLGIADSAQAGFVGLPFNLKAQLEHIRFEEPALAPMAHTRFCMEYPQDCRIHKMIFRGSRIKLTPERIDDLVTINARVNSQIRAEHNDAGIAGESWDLSPAYGDCNDYAVTKRHELIARGWPAQSLLLAEVVTGWGEHHLVVVVRTRSADLVIDSLTASIRTWARTGYRWVRVQTPQNPMYWAKVGSPIA
jgi:predicted transglutaminase-like cysteine proteinase